MYCRNCGNQLDDNAVACMKCGHDPKKGVNNCPNCGVIVTKDQVVCVKCGGSLAHAGEVLQLGESSNKDKTVFLVLAIFLGALGVHNFYAGYTAKGVAQLAITVISCGWLAIVSSIWAIIEGVTVDKDATGKPFKK